MGSTHVCVCWLRYRQLIIYLLILFASSSILTHDYGFMAEGRSISSLTKVIKKGKKVQGLVTSTKAQIGSRPPKCERRCGICGHCEAVQVPVVPQVQSHRSHPAARGTPSVAYFRSDDLSNYKPMSWKCKCGDYLFNP